MRGGRPKREAEGDGGHVRLGGGEGPKELGEVRNGRANGGGGAETLRGVRERGEEERGEG